MTVRVLQPGLYTLVVDFGRPGARSLGVPVGGAADRTSLARGNALLGNPPDAPALEINLAGPVLRAEDQVACVLSGAPFELASGRQSLETGTTFTLQPGEELRIGSSAIGARSYLCVRGGFNTPEILGSRSSLEPLRSGDELACASSRTGRRFVRALRSWAAPEETLRFVPGPQADWFDMGDFVSHEFVISPASNRRACSQSASKSSGWVISANGRFSNSPSSYPTI